MIKRIVIKALLIVGLATTSLMGNAYGDGTYPEDGIVEEVHILSLRFEGAGSASLVARPCDTNTDCKNILARISTKTVWRDGNAVISYQQAKRLNWNAALLVFDKFSNALVVERIEMGGN